MPNLIAYIALVAWIPAGILFYRLFRPVTAATIVLLGAMILLPANCPINLPGLPAVDRHGIGGLASILGYYLGVPRNQRFARRFGWPEVLIGIQVFCAFISAYTNPDPLRYGAITLPGLTEYDALGVAFNRMLMIGVPFFLGCRVVRTFDDVLSVLRVIAYAGLVYIPFVLWEARMSPQLHTMLYGYFPHEFIQHIRAGGYRPVVLTSSGLDLALFLATAAVACAGLARIKSKVLGMPALVPFLALVGTLALCLSLGPLLIGLVASAAVLSTRAVLQARVTKALSFVILLYPLLRSQDMFPTGVFLGTAQTISQDRADSLNFRFRNEDALLSKARERPAFGWGTWGRNRVYDVSTGTDLSVTDGYWIIEIGMFGLTGFLSFFGLLLAPVVLAASRLRFLPRGSPRVLIATVLVLVSVRAVDLLPNAFYAPMTMFLAGSLLPFASLARRKTDSGPAPTATSIRRPQEMAQRINEPA
jgi:hypothetical protein